MGVNFLKKYHTQVDLNFIYAILATKSYDFNQIVVAFIKANASLNIQDNNGFTALIWG